MDAANGVQKGNPAGQGSWAGLDRTQGIVDFARLKIILNWRAPPFP